jgi:phosphatidylglycerophosphate synthase
MQACDMESTSDLAARRPLKSRATAWACGMSRLLLRIGASPNAISATSVLFAMAGGGILVSIGMNALPALWLIAAAACVQLRLLCNLMDGMVAIEGGKKSPTGDLFNEVPDRIADVMILAGAGFCALNQPWGIHLGWLAASLAVMTACIRMQGATLTGRHDFRGPMAKPHRMALITLTCLLGAFFAKQFDWFLWALAVMVVGEVITLTRRLMGIAAILKSKA